jgi:hypothetical protein
MSCLFYSSNCGQVGAKKKPDKKFVNKSRFSGGLSCERVNLTIASLEIVELGRCVPSNPLMESSSNPLIQGCRVDEIEVGFGGAVPRLSVPLMQRVKGLTMWSAIQFRQATKMLHRSWPQCSLTCVFVCVMSCIHEFDKGPPDYEEGILFEQTRRTTCDFYLTAIVDVIRGAANNFYLGGSTLSSFSC